MINYKSLFLIIFFASNANSMIDSKAENFTQQFNEEELEAELKELADGGAIPFMPPYLLIRTIDYYYISEIEQAKSFEEIEKNRNDCISELLQLKYLYHYNNEELAEKRSNLDKAVEKAKKRLQRLEVSE
jgi:hypothetical protein